MTPQEAIQILMLNPAYLKMNLAERRALVKEFCRVNIESSERRVIIKSLEMMKPIS